LHVLLEQQGKFFVPHALPPLLELLLVPPPLLVDSQPLSLFPSLSEKPGSQSVNAQAPAAQTRPTTCCAVAVHEWSQAPQCSTSVRVEVSQPRTSPTQCAKPFAHVVLQTPDSQRGVPLSPVHAVAHFPQLSTSLVTSRQNPPQQACPPAHGLESLQASTQLPLGLQVLPSVHVAAVKHATHWCRSVAQSGLLGLSFWHSSDALQPTVHWFFALQ